MNENSLLNNETYFASDFMIPEIKIFEIIYLINSGNLFLLKYIKATIQEFLF